MRVQCTCRHCGAVFATNNARRSRPLPIHCSRACAGASRRQRIERRCEHCGAAFSVRPSGLIWGSGRFCSATCADLARERVALPRVCETCGAAFLIYPSNLRGAGAGRFCSLPCRQESPAALFWRYAVKGAHPDACWQWTGATDQSGYGRQWSKRRGMATQASRLSWEIHIGPIPPGLHVCHRCDNPPCSNPEHLFLATHAENMRDMARKGRDRWRFKRERFHSE